MEKYTIIEDYSYVKPGRAYICFYKPIVELGLSVRSFNALVRAGKRFYEDIRSMTYEDICKIPHIGRIHAEEILITMRLYEAGYDIEKIGKRHDETEASTPLQEPDKESYMEKLDKLIGLDKVKEQVRKIAAYAKMNKALCEKGKEKSFVSINEKAKEKILSMFRSAVFKPEAGNGRFCRNLVASAILDYAGRNYGNGDNTGEKDFVLRAEDFSVPECVVEKRENSRIGFSM